MYAWLINKYHFILILSLLIIITHLVGCSKSSNINITNTITDTHIFEGEKAMEFIKEFVLLGPKPAGSGTNIHSARWLAEKITQFSIEPLIDVFYDETPYGKEVFYNVLCEIKGKTYKTIIIATHYDTKIGISEDFIGANDSASGVGLLLELAWILSKTNCLSDNILLAFLDGEECKIKYSTHDGLHGSKRLLDLILKNHKKDKVIAFIVVDMIGDADLTITIPENSSPSLKKLLLEAAGIEGIRHLIRLVDMTIIDDHVPFLEAEIPAIDIIDFEYGSKPYLNDYWHTTNDTIDKLNVESLKYVGRMLLRFLILLTDNNCYLCGNIY